MRPLLERIDAKIRNLERSVSAKTTYPGGLTRREVEVLRLVAYGYTSAEIGEKLFISGQTVAKHVHNLPAKTGMANRAEATGWAVRSGIAE